MQTEAEKQLAALVAMRTLTDDIPATDKALDYIEKYLAERGMHTQRKRFENGHDTLLASTRPNNLQTPKVLLGAHVDVVAASPTLFKLRAEGDKLIGRGTYDMKFAIAGYMQVIEELKDRLGDYDLGIMVSTDEEIGSTGAYALVREGSNRASAYCPIQPLQITTLR